MDKIVVLTAPHAYCVNDRKEEKYHLCDKAAGDAADLLEKHLISRGFKVKKFVSTEHRDKDNDMNRKYTRDREYRLNITEYLKTHKGQIIMLLDVHSYPGHLQYYGEFDAYLLDDTKYENHSFSSSLLFKFLVDSGFKSKILQGIQNDIQDQAISEGIESTLIEFNEDLLKNPEKFNAIAKTVAYAIKENRIY